MNSWTAVLRNTNYYFNFTFCILKAFVKTDTELNAIARPANMGFNNPSAAIGIPIPL